MSTHQDIPAFASSTSTSGVGTSAKGGYSRASHINHDFNCGVIAMNSTLDDHVLMTLGPAFRGSA